MNAAVYTTYGGPEVVRVVDIDRPTVGHHDVLVRVHVTTVNRTDCGFRAAHPFIVRFFSGLTRPKRTVLGNEFAGVVEATGPHVTAFEVGDRVFGYSEPGFGAHAEYLAMPEDGPITTIPEGLTFEQAAPSTEGSHYAHSLIRAAAITSGHRVIVYGATGAIGSAAVQLLNELGAMVTAVCDTRNVELVTRLGADRVIDYTTTDFTTDEPDYDAVLDAVGKSSFGACRHLLKPRGVYLSTDLGRLLMNPILALVTPLFGGKRVRFPIPKTFDKALVEHLRSLLASGAFKPVVDRTYPLDQIVEAYRYVETGQKVGNVLLLIQPT
jgi:NADPH:quinone reductase-like Zn-dependent oxidoreductase